MLKLKRKNRTKTILLSLSLLGMFLIGIYSTVVVASTYQVALIKETEYFSITQYEEDAWHTTVNASSTPTDWFEGEANMTDAQSKYTTLGWSYSSWEFYDVLYSVILQKSQIPLLMAIAELGYNETEINNNYTNTFNLWFGVRSYWNFTTINFEESPSNAQDPILIFQNPGDYWKMLDDYNHLVEDIQNDPSIPPFIKIQFSNITGDEFLWQLIFSGFGVALPANEYLTILIDELGCENATVNNNILTIERIGEANYTVEITYGAKGTQLSFVVKDVDSNIIYAIKSTGNENYVLNIILIVITISVIGFVAYIIYKKKTSRD